MPTNPTVIRISCEVKANYIKVQKMIDARTQVQTLAAVVGWLTEGTPESVAAIKSIARYRSEQHISQLASDS
jgi:hypothetical protein